MKKPWYCAKCWQEFEDPRSHNVPSSYNGERLNGHCDGDIRMKEKSWHPKVKCEEGPLLDLDATPGITIE